MPLSFSAKPAVLTLSLEWLEIYLKARLLSVVILIVKTQVKTFYYHVLYGHFGSGGWKSGAARWSSVFSSEIWSVIWASSIVFSWRLLEADSKSMRSMSGSRRNSGSSLVSSSSASSNLSHLEEDTWILWGRIVNEWEEWRRKKDKLLKVGIWNSVHTEAESLHTPAKIAGLCDVKNGRTYSTFIVKLQPLN